MLWATVMSPVLAQEECPPPISCAPCGEVITNMPLPAADNCGVNPLQNYLATSVDCMRRGWNGIYFGTGFGYGSIDYNLKIPGIFIEKNRINSYITEYLTVGYVHNSRQFMLAAELGFYHNSVTSPLFYHDPSFAILTPFPLIPAITATVMPCDVRLDINAQNHGAFDLLPGLALAPNLAIYGRVGVEYTNYTWHRRVCIPQVIVTPDFLNIDINDVLLGDFGDLSDQVSDSVVSLRLGAGVTYSAGQHLSFHVNYIHISGSEAKFKPRPFLFDDSFLVITPVVVPLPLASDLTLTAENKIDPSRNEILLGMTVSF